MSGWTEAEMSFVLIQAGWEDGEDEPRSVCFPQFKWLYMYVCIIKDHRRSHRYIRKFGDAFLLLSFLLKPPVLGLEFGLNK